MESRIDTPMPSYHYRSCQRAWALKIKSVFVNASADPEADDEEFIASDKFGGAILVFEEKGYAQIQVDADWFREHRPKSGGYYVVRELTDVVRNEDPVFMYAEEFKKVYIRL